MSKLPKVSVIITAHNYGKYLPKCVGSVISQRYTDWELIIVNDGSGDNTVEILKNYQERYEDKIKVIHLKGVGLAKACNIGIASSNGEYIIRLDADDYFDENILFLESNILDNDPHIHMVYPDHYRINKYGEIVDSCRLQRVNDEVKLLDRSPLAAGAMFRRECYDDIGGYNEELRYQEDYDFWIRFVEKYNVYNVNLPLMYYRKHDTSMSNNFDARIKARQYVKKKFVEAKGYHKDKNILAVIPAMGLFRNREKLAIKTLSNKPLISYTIDEALKTNLINRVIVSTEDQEVAEVAIQYGAEVPFLRPIELSRTNVSFEKVLQHMLRTFRERGDEDLDFIVVLPYITPFREEKHITEAIDTVLLYSADSVIGVTTDLTFHWKPGEYGLTPVGYQKRLVKEDKETVYKENGSIYVVNAKNLQEGGYLGKRIGHIEMSIISSWKVETDFDLWIAERMLKDKIV